MLVLTYTHNHSAMHCKTTVRHLLRPWYFILVADMRWRPRFTWRWQSFVHSNIPYGIQWYSGIKTGPPSHVAT